MGDYVPDRGDLVWMNFDPQAGHEQKGRRPALVLSPRRYNDATSLALTVPITSQVKGYPFEIALPDSSPIKGVILSDQIRTLDWRARNAEKAGFLHDETLALVIHNLNQLINP